MKKLILIFFAVMLAAMVFGQDNNKQQTIIPPPDSVNIVALRDVNAFYKYLTENLSHKDFVELDAEKTLNLFKRWAIIEWDKKKKKPKP